MAKNALHVRIREHSCTHTRVIAVRASCKSWALLCVRVCARAVVHVLAYRTFSPALVYEHAVQAEQPTMKMRADGLHDGLSEGGQRSTVSVSGERSDSTSIGSHHHARVGTQP